VLGEPEVPAGQVTSLLAGAPTSARIEVVGDRVRVTTGPVVLDVQAVSADGSVLRPSAGGRLELDRGATLKVDVQGGSPGAAFAGWVFSTPRSLGSTRADNDGAVQASFALPRDLPGGHHTLQVNGMTPQGMRSISLGLDVDGSPLPLWRPIDHPKAVVSIAVAALALVSVTSLSALGGAAGASTAAGTSGRAEHGKRGKVAGVKVKYAKVSDAEGSRGDRSRTWRLRGYARLDALSQTLPLRLAPRSPAVARLVADSNHLRAVLGVLSLATVPLGVGLGVTAGVGAHGLAAPTTASLAACLTLGVVDALAGLASAVALMATLALTGSLSSLSDVRGVLGVAALCFALPLIAGGLRPLRRPSGSELDQLWYRAGDYLLLPAFAAFTTYKLLGALSGLYGHKVALASDASQLAVVIAGALVVRLVLEDVAARAYPERLLAVTASKVPWPSKLQQVSSVLVKAAMFGFVAAPFVGLRAPLWVGLVLFVTPQLLRIWQQDLPKRRALWFVLPRKLVKLAVMLLIGAFGAVELGRQVSDPVAFIGLSFVVLSLPGTIEGVASLFVDEPDEAPTWWSRLAGLGAGLVAVPIIAFYGL
jgi:hypothetical protein